jgi:predicted O-methyltransferase YrrM
MFNKYIVLFFGQVHKEAGYHQEGTMEVSDDFKKMASEINQFNQHVSNDPRVEIVMLPIFDGLSIIRKIVE